MARVAKTEPEVEIFTEGQRFVFEDGTRQVTQAEENALKRYMENGGPFKITFADKKKGGSS